MKESVKELRRQGRSYQKGGKDGNMAIRRQEKPNTKEKSRELWQGARDDVLTRR